MTRRPLRKIDRALDLSRHLVAPEQLPRPWNAAALFGREAPLEVEVGSGKGLFLVQAATANREHDFLGIEIAERYARFSAHRLARLKLENARLIHGDAQHVLADLLPPGCVAAVHVYFPDPWWKERHKKRRVMNWRFLNDVVRVLRPRGNLHFWSDVEEYFHTTLDLIRALPQLSGPLAVEERAAQHDLDFRTHFERRMRLHGEAVYRAEFCKAAD